MMLYPPVAELVSKVGNRYALVNVIAKRARAIAAEMDAYGDTTGKKPVSAAIDEIYTGKLVEGEARKKKPDLREENPFSPFRRTTAEDEEDDLPEDDLEDDLGDDLEDDLVDGPDEDPDEDPEEGPDMPEMDSGTGTGEAEDADVSPAQELSAGEEALASESPVNVPEYEVPVENDGAPAEEPAAGEGTSAEEEDHAEEYFAEEPQAAEKAPEDQPTDEEPEAGSFEKEPAAADGTSAGEVPTEEPASGDDPD